MSGPDDPVPGDVPAAVDPVQRAEYARRMHHRQMIRRGLVTGVILAIVGLLTAISIPVYTQLSNQWVLRSAGFRVDWQLDEDNWMNGGVTSVTYKYRGGQLSSRDQLGFKALSRLLHVKSLSLAECDISEQDLSILGRLVELEELNLSRMDQYRHQWGPLGLSDACLVPVQGLTRLHVLSLSGNRITDQGLAMIAHLPSLEYLALDATEVGDGGLVHLEGMRSLKSVSLGATRMTPEGIKTLQAARPGLEIDLHVDPEIERAVKALRRKNP